MLTKLENIVVSLTEITAVEHIGTNTKTTDMDKTWDILMTFYVI